VPATATPTTAAATTTTPFDTLELQIGGIGPYPHGMSITKVLPGLQAVLGAPSTDEAREYPTLDGSGGYLTAQGDLGYGTPHGREVCWAFGFCAEFGGPTVDELTLTGWTYGGDTHHTLHSRSGVSIGTRWSDVPAMDVQSGGCHTQGDGTVDGIVLQLESSGLPFGGTDTAGSYLPNLPDPKDVTVLTMKSGDVPMFLFTDC
jgi:hypothetical protein